MTMTESKQTIFIERSKLMVIRAPLVYITVTAY